MRGSRRAVARAGRVSRRGVACRFRSASHRQWRQSAAASVRPVRWSGGAEVSRPCRLSRTERSRYLQQASRLFPCPAGQGGDRGVICPGRDQPGPPGGRSWAPARAIAEASRLQAAQTRVAGVPEAGRLCVLNDPRPDAFALPGGLRRSDRIVVTSGMLRALGPAEREALLAHERAYLAARHHPSSPPPSSPAGATPPWLRSP
ncbi:M48 family metalloprotease [Streptomyces sp. NPDC053813]|uniref:M48 family metalloprotease n=1 Tax=Streptomyces sp. NPDC053813 TaxID=3365717 RepID=UPI0037CF0492